MKVASFVSIHGVINVGWENLFVAMLLVMMVVFSSLLFLVEWLEDENYYVETFFLFISFLKKIWVFVFTKFVPLPQKLLSGLESSGAADNIERGDGGRGRVQVPRGLPRVPDGIN